MANVPQKGRENGRSRSLLVLTVLALTAILAEALVFSSLDHDCCGEGCPVCAQMEAALRLLEGLGRAAAIVFAAGLLGLCAKSPAKPAGTFLPAAITPVSLKTKITS